MEPGYWWLIATILFVLFELVTSGFGVVCFAIGSLVAAVAAFAGGGFSWQIGLFSAGSLLSLVFVRPLMLKYLTRDRDSVASNVDALTGRRCVVVETIDTGAGTGYVKIDGDVWKAVSADQSVIPAGTQVEVVRQDSIVLTVK
ncbi:MAG: NfeD family protein [Paludibacteraceae bacterium]|nr:NfeD family protein [Paludibacteraceae bacterium]